MKKNQQTKYLFSVVMPVYNAERYLQKAAMSVLQQTYRNLELILIEDRSTDQSAAICQKITEADGRVKLLQGDHNGVASARNKGIRASEGAYITFVDADDIIAPDTYEQVARLIEIDPETYIYVFRCQSFYAETEIEYRDQTDEGLRQNQCTQSCYSIKGFAACIDAMLRNKQLGFFLCNKVYSKSIFQTQEISEQYMACEDFVFNWQVAERIQNLKVIDHVQYYYRHTNQSLTRSISKKTYQDCVTAYQDMIRRYGDQISNTALEICYQEKIAFLLILLDIMVLRNQYDRNEYQIIRQSLKTDILKCGKLKILLSVRRAAAMISYSAFKTVFYIEMILRKVFHKKTWYVSP